MKVLIDADGCPVIAQTILLCEKYKAKCIIISDTSHIFDKYDVEKVIVSKGNDSADFVLTNMVEENDLVITQDYGLAAMCLAKKARVISQNGIQFSNENMDLFLETRYIGKMQRKAHQRLKGPAKRTAKQNVDFIQTLTKLLQLN